MPIVAGQLDEYAKYKFHCGQVRGLSTARQLVVETLAPLVDDDRHRELRDR